MKRLRDEVDSNDAQLAAAGRLVEKIAPLTPSEARARRVRRALERKAVRRRNSRLGVVFALLGLAGSAAAFGVSEWISEPKVHKAPSGDPSEVDSGGSTQPKRDVDAPRSDAELIELSDEGSTEKEIVAKDLAKTPSADTSHVETVQVKRAGARERAQRSASATSAQGLAAASAAKVQEEPAPTLSEARLVKEAVEALRTGDNPGRAERLLSEYRKNSTSGHLDEEALALTIEVALAKRSPEAARHARLYLQKYPGGKFTPLAKRALQSQ